MYLFKDQDVVEISINCKLCLKEVKFSISAEEYKNITQFPVKKEHVHGSPQHRLVVYINKNLDIENFKIEELEIDEEKPVQDEELTRQVLSNLELADDEIDLYLQITGRDAVSLGELALLANMPKEETQNMAQRFVDKGLFRSIVGATPHYQALPPYSALISQLNTFHSYITDLRERAPVELNESFSKLEASADGVKNLREYTDFMLDLKQNTLSQIMEQRKKFDQTTSVIDEIRGLQDFILNLESEAKNIMDSQSEDLARQFDDIGTKISQSMDRQVDDLTNQFDTINNKITQIVNSQVDEFKNQFQNMKVKISQNLQKLRLGVLQQAVDQVIETTFSEWFNKITENLNEQLAEIQRASKDGLVKTKIGLNRQLSEIQKAQSEGIKNTTDQFNNMLISRLKESIDSTVDNIKGITTTTAESGDAIKELFGDISKNFSKAVTMAEEKLGGMSESVFDSFGNLRETFSNTIIKTLNEVLGDILERLELSERATRQFWDMAISGGIGAAALTMKDIWFIRSIEGAKAHVNDQISQAKMRVLIVAPQITDVNIDSIKACKSHVNIRIATVVDLANPEHVSNLQVLTNMDNVSVRNRRLQNLWGINKDYEEVILCVISKTDYGTEIAGIGSIIQEHIKIFVPILEDAWVGAQKGITPPAGVAQPRQPTAPTTYAPKQEPIKRPEPVVQRVEPPKVEKVKIPEGISPTFSTKPKPGQATSLSKMFDDIFNFVDSLPGADIASKLGQIKDAIEDERGYSGVIAPINLAISSLKFNDNTLSSSELDQLRNKMNFWRKKLNI